jgi:hypothetical protein
MPCTWTGYGASPPAAYKYRESKEAEGGDDFSEREERTRGKFFGRAEGSKLQKRKKKGKQEGAKLLRNELEGRNKFEKGDRGGLQRSRNRGGVFGSKVRKQNHPFRVPNSCSSLSTVAFGHHHPAPPFRHHRRCHQQQQRRNRNKTKKEKEQEREQKQRGSKGEKGEEPPTAVLFTATSITPAAIALPVDNSPVRSRRKKRKQRRTELKKNAEKKRKKGRPPSKPLPQAATTSISNRR